VVCKSKIGYIWWVENSSSRKSFCGCNPYFKEKLFSEFAKPREETSR